MKAIILSDISFSLRSYKINNTSEKKIKKNRRIRQINSLAVQEMGFWTLLQGCLLIANSLAILNEDRFLAHRGLSFSGVGTKSFKAQLIGLIYATQYLRVLLLLLNSITIVVKLVSG